MVQRLQYLEMKLLHISMKTRRTPPVPDVLFILKSNKKIYPLTITFVCIKTLPQERSKNGAIILILLSLTCALSLESS